MKKFSHFIAIIVIIFMPFALCAQHLFSVSQNGLSKEKVSQLKTQIAQSEISTLSLTRNNEAKNIYSVSLSSVENTKIIILNEQTENHIVITPVEEMRAEFQLAPLFIEEMKQGVMGEAAQFFIVETSSDLSVRNVSSVSASQGDTYIPQFFYGNKNDVKEALPKDRQIVAIFKQKPRLILASDEPELLSFAAQYEEAMSYYGYLYKLPDGTLCTYDEHFNPVHDSNAVKVGSKGMLEFTLTGNLTTQKPATEYALSLWSQKLAGEVPVKINVDLIYISNPNVIGQSYHMPMAQNTGQVPTSPTNTWYPSSLWHQLVGYASISGLNIKLEMNSNFNFYFETTGNPSYSQMDWITVMLHETNHGLGFYPICQSDGRYLPYSSYSSNPGIFDRQLYQGSTGDVCLTDLNQSQRAALLISNNLFAGAPASHLLIAHNGNRVKMYAPNPYQGGSSGSHWNNSPGFTTFMTAGLSQGIKIHNISTREMGMLKDMGWKEVDLNLVSVVFYPNGGSGGSYKQEFEKEVEQELIPNTFKRTGYEFTHWNTNQNGSGTNYENKQPVTLTENMSLYAQWKASTYTLNFNPGEGATVDYTSKPVVYAKPVGELPVAQKNGYAFKGWRISSTNITEGYIWNFTQDKEAVPNWTMITHDIVATTSSGGKISPAGTKSVQEGNDQTYIITPNEDYYVGDVFVDDKSVGARNEYTFENVTASHTIHAVFYNVGINEYASKVKVAPNPTTGELTISFAELAPTGAAVDNGQWTINNLEVFDVFGKKQKSRKAEKQNTVMNISDLANGIYFLKISTEKGEIVKKVIKH